MKAGSGKTGGKAGSGGPKNSPGNTRIVTDTGRGGKNGSSTPKAGKKRSPPRFYEAKIRLTADEFARGQPYFGEQRYLQKFAQDAFWEKVRRASAHDKEARANALRKDIELIKELTRLALMEMRSQGELDFLFRITGTEEGGGDGKTREA